ncbi:hypothetical protein P3X46_031002 [Hevea brasiliensis]|uniref:RING-type E3 ubiquitin transferase n=1 Tax=Hevea brasiliensis TaxID=3981 RepID=A0ABQ9KIX5_HEVBR|nr:RING-H2 finger protein ATL39-like [Hevea brasiliensis]KAJ9140343.1 hypothetical protein P3X46_031002 [Hevea brasiliensis]
MVMEIIISVIILFVGIAVLVLIHVCIVGRAFRRGNENGQDIVEAGFNTSRNGTRKISNDDLKNLPCFDYMAAQRGESSFVDCVVCLENFNVGDKCRLLPNCKHSFHTQCIDSWLLKSPICPICRTSVNPLNIGASLSQESSISIAVGVEL